MNTITDFPTGGPAFPFRRKTLADMEAPFETHEGDTGMTLRDYFAAKAMTRFVSRSWGSYMAADIADCAYELADAMLEARMRRRTDEPRPYRPMSTHQFPED